MTVTIPDKKRYLLAATALGTVLFYPLLARAEADVSEVDTEPSIEVFIENVDKLRPPSSMMAPEASSHDTLFDDQTKSEKKKKKHHTQKKKTVKKAHKKHSSSPKTSESPIKKSEPYTTTKQPYRDGDIGSPIQSETPPPTTENKAPKTAPVILQVPEVKTTPKVAPIQPIEEPIVTKKAPPAPVAIEVPTPPAEKAMKPQPLPTNPDEMEKLPQVLPSPPQTPTADTQSPALPKITVPVTTPPAASIPTPPAASIPTPPAASIPPAPAASTPTTPVSKPLPVVPPIVHTPSPIRTKDLPEAAPKKPASHKAVASTKAKVEQAEEKSIWSSAIDWAMGRSKPVTTKEQDTPVEKEPTLKETVPTPPTPPTTPLPPQSETPPPTPVLPKPPAASSELPPQIAVPTPTKKPDIVPPVAPLTDKSANKKPIVTEEDDAFVGQQKKDALPSSLPPASTASSKKDLPPTQEAPKEVILKDQSNKAPEKAANAPSGNVKIANFSYSKGQFAIADDSKKQLDTVLKGMPASKRLLIISYASGTPDQAGSDRLLSLQRAIEVRKYMLGQGIDEMHINVQAMGDTSPTDDKDHIDLFTLESGGATQ